MKQLYKVYGFIVVLIFAIGLTGCKTSKLDGAVQTGESAVASIEKNSDVKYAEGASSKDTNHEVKFDDTKRFDDGTNPTYIDNQDKTELNEQVANGESETKANDVSKNSPANDIKDENSNSVEKDTDAEKTSDKNDNSEQQKSNERSDSKDTVKNNSSVNNKNSANNKTSAKSKDTAKKTETKNQEKGMKLTATLYVECKTILSNLDNLADGKEVCVPESGVIFEKKEVTFEAGESVYDVLVREMKNAKIQLEANFTPVYESAYVEGINNLYEFDCGELSGWMYSVNGDFPNYGCSTYLLEDGDVIEWHYSCDLGRDLGVSVNE